MDSGNKYRHDNRIIKRKNSINPASILPELWLTNRRRLLILSVMDLTIIAERMNALGSEPRLNIYLTLIRAGEEGLAVGEIQKKLDIPGSTLTHHLKRMVQAELVTQEKQGTTLTCRANFKQMTRTIDYFLGQCCAEGQCATPLPKSITPKK